MSHAKCLRFGILFIPEHLVDQNNSLIYFSNPLFWKIRRTFDLMQICSLFKLFIFFFLQWNLLPQNNPFMNLTIVLGWFLIRIVWVRSMSRRKISSRRILLKTCDRQYFLNHCLVVLKRSMHLRNRRFKVLAIDVTIDRRLWTVSAFLLRIGWLCLIRLSHDQTIKQASFSFNFSFGLFLNFVQTLNYSCWFLLYLL